MERTLPYSWYVDPEILRREHERIFRSAWQYAGHTGEAPEPGTFFAARAGRTPVVVTRARDGELRAFLNVCRHRGHQVVEGAGRRETLQCPYHAWTYGLDGSLRAAPRAEELADFDQSELGLCRVAVVSDWLSSFVDFKRPESCHWSPETILVMSRRLTRRITLKMDYLPFEFATVLWKDDHLDDRGVFAGVKIP